MSAKENAVTNKLALTCLAFCLLAACGGGTGAASSSPATPSAPPVATQPASCGPGKRDTRQVSIGFNVNALFWEGLYGDPLMQAAVRAQGKPTLRWPGGTESDYFDWSKGRPVETCRYGGCRTWDTNTLTPPALFQRFSTFSEGTPANWQRVNRAVDGRTMLVANLMTAAPAEMVDWIRAAAQAGMPIELVELGNEPYFARVEGTDNNARLFPDARSHVEAAKSLASELRRQFPEVKLAQPAFVPRVDVRTGQLVPGHDARMLTWNEGILAAGAVTHADAFALHFYPQLPARGLDDDATYLDRLATFATAYWTATKTTPQWQSLPADRRIWITEFNVSFAAAPELQGTWAHGLYMAQFTLLALSDPRVDHLLAHMLTGNAQWQSIVHPGRSPDIPTPPAGQAYAATPTAVALATIAETMNGSDCGTPIAASEYVGARPSAVPVGWRSSGSSGDKAAIVNMSSASVDLDIQRDGWSEAAATAYRASPLDRVSRESGLIRETINSRQGLLRVPAYSLVLVSRTR